MKQLIDLKHGERYLEVLRVQKQLERAIAVNHRVKQNRVLINNGSNGSLVTVLSAFAYKWLKEYSKTPTILVDIPNYFRTLHILNEWGYKKITVQRDRCFNLNIGLYKEVYMINKPDLVIVTDPNNPTGKALKPRELIEILDLFLEEAIVILDRTLININKSISTTELLKRYEGKKLIILESFSKKQSLAHERIGYAVVASDEIADFLKPKLTLGYNVDAMKAALKCLSDMNVVLKNKDRVVESIAELKFLPKPIQFFGADSNYGILVFPDNYDGKIISEKLKRKKILVMPGEEIRLPRNTIRIHMSGKKNVAKLIKELRRLKC